MAPLLMTGMLGGFTTFSAFSLDALTIFERGQVGQAALYVIASVVLSLLAIVLGVMVARGVWT
jgi:CrcB protein